MPEFVLEHEPAGFARIKVIGVGGGGCNAVDSMYDMGLQSTEFYVINTDLQALRRTKCPNRIQIGAELTAGRGCGADPSLGEKCMVEAREAIMETLQGADIVFVTAGLGGGTGTGGAPVVAQYAKEMGILTVCIVTRPFKFEGTRRQRSAEAGIERMRESCDTMIAISNEKLLENVGPKAAMTESFAVANRVLALAVQSISDLVSTPGLINVDFNDIRTIMGGRGGAVMGVGVGKGENRASEAVKKATSSPLLDKVVIQGATGVLVCVTGGADMTLAEVSEAAGLIQGEADPDAEVIFGAVIDESMTDTIRVTMIATGFREDISRRQMQEAQRNQRVAATATVSAPIVAPPVVAQPPRFILQDTLDDNPVFSAETPKPTEETAPAAPVAEPTAPARPSLRDKLQAMMENDEESSELPGIGPSSVRPASSQPQAPTAPTNGGIRVVRSSGGGNLPSNVRPATPASPAVAVRPAAPQKPLGSTHPERNGGGADSSPVVATESAPKVALYNPGTAAAEEEKARENFDEPAFLRRRRSMFD